MENDKLKEELNNSFADLKEKFNESLDYIEKNNKDKGIITDMWKDSIKDFLSYAVNTSEKYKNKDIVKAITKAIMFGK